ncbi:MAG: inorganic diphosphatase [Patescibacteria group bacterium]
MEHTLIADAREYLGRVVEVTIDRPFQSKHPKHGWSYMLNYGFVPGTMSPDGEELDAYVIGADQPIASFTGTCVAVIHRTNDDDDKLIVVSKDKLDISDEEIRSSTRFQEQFFDSEIWRAQ